MDNGTARVISTLILVGGLLAVVFATGGAEQNYATVNFDGGYSRIGIIYEERVTSEATIILDNEVVIDGDINDVIAWIQANSDDTSTWKEGVNLTASTAIEWTASRQNFTLTTDSYDITSDGTLVALGEVAKLQAMLSQANSSRQLTSLNALEFSKDPNSGTIGQLLSILK